jgi:hypothetical protein
MTERRSVGTVTNDRAKTGEHKTPRSASVLEDTYDLVLVNPIQSRKSSTRKVNGRENTVH